MSETCHYVMDLMIDLETLGTAPNAAIIAIGVWPFRLDGGPVGHDSFYRNVDAESSIDAGLKVDGSAVMWWMQQSDAARERLRNPEPVGLIEALLDFDAYCRGIGGDEKAFRLWAHGANFDLPILESAWRAEVGSGDSLPWRYNAARDTRTLFHAVGMDWDTEFEALITAQHDALEDARALATLVKRAWSQLHRGEM